MAAEDSGVELDRYKEKPNIFKLLTALTNSPLTNKWNAVGDEKAHLGFLLQTFFDDEEFDDENLKEEFVGDENQDAVAEDCFFIEWLKDEEDERPGMSVRDESKLQEIFNDLKAAFAAPLIVKNNNNQKNKPIKQEQKNGGYIIDPYSFKTSKKYNINVTEEGINLIDKLLTEQCADLRVKEVMAAKDKATYSIIMVGKQNNNQPLLMYLCDVYNRYRIQRRKKLKRRYGGIDTIEFKAKWSDPDTKKFICEKCKGFDLWLSKDYNKSQITDFQDRCQSSISVLYRRLLGRPPMLPHMLDSVINDSIIQICWYIFQAYSFVHQYACHEKQHQAAQTLPCQIDMVIIPKDFQKTKHIEDDEGTDDEGTDGHDPDDGGDGEEKEEGIGNIDERLKGQKDVIKKKILPGTADRTMRQSVEKLFSNNRHQRGIIIIDRRKDKDTDKDNKDSNNKEDIFYCYQPDDKRKCSSMEKNPEIFLSESLVQNSRTCLLPKYINQDVGVKDIGINRNVGDTLTLSFHCLTAEEIRVYLSYCGWGTRFFIEDIKYYLPMIFAKSQEQKLRDAFEKEQNRDFPNKYDQIKAKCPDPKFEKFYKDLVYGSAKPEDRKPCH